MPSHSICKRATPAIPDHNALLLLLCCVQYQKPSWHVIHHKMASATVHKNPGNSLSFCRPIHAVAKALYCKRSWLSKGDTNRGYPLAFTTPTLCSLHRYCIKSWQAQGQQDLSLLDRRKTPSTETFLYFDRLDKQSADQEQQLSVAGRDPPL